MDTSTVALEMYARADLWQFQGNLDTALFQLYQLIGSFPEHLSLLDDAHYLKAKIYKKQQKWDKAIEELLEVLKHDDLLTDEALLDLAKIYQEIKKDDASALKYYERIVLDHPGSVYTVEARKHYRKLRGN